MNVVLPGLSPGAVFAGYRIEEYAGRGGMGVIYRATELRPERTVALKVVAPELAADEAFRERFLRESQIAASIEHPHVVPVSRVGEEDGRLFIAMRFIRGHDLARLIATEGRLEPHRAAKIVDQLADALDTAHEQGLVHRDVKPANVLVERRRRGEHVYLTDFGLTKHLTTTARLTSTGTVVGTTDYMAPEQWTGGRLDARVDVYSLGCMLFELLTGRVPYLREAQPARMYAHLNAPAPIVSDEVPGVPSRFDEIVRRAVAKDPNDRYTSAGDLGFAALAAAEGRPIDRSERSVAAGEAAPRTQQAVADRSMRSTGATALVSDTAHPADASSELESTKPLPASELRSPREATDEPATDGHRQRGARDLGVQPPPKHSRVRLLGGLAIAVLAAAVVGIVVISGRSSGGNKARSGPLALAYGAPWKLTAARASPAGFALSAPAVLGSGQTTLALGAVRNSAAVPGDPPPAMVSRFGHPISSSATRVGQYEAKQYVWDRGGGQSVSAFVVPTANVDLALICAGKPSEGAFASCEALVAAVTVAGATPVVPGVDRTLSGRLQSVLAPVSTERSRLDGSNRSALPNRVQALSQAATAEQKAATKLSELNAPRNQKSISDLRAALTGEATNLLALSEAAAHDDATAYDRSRAAAISASRKLANSVSTLKELGFALPSFSQLRLPGAPAPAQSTTPSSGLTTSSSPPASSTPSGASSGAAGSGTSNSGSTSSGGSGSSSRSGTTAVGGSGSGSSGSGSTPVGP